MTKTTITANKNASLEVKGEVEVKNSKGEVIKKTDKNESVWLCRCGHSKNKPFCDGTHNTINFEAE